MGRAVRDKKQITTSVSVNMGKGKDKETKWEKKTEQRMRKSDFRKEQTTFAAPASRISKYYFGGASLKSLIFAKSAPHRVLLKALLVGAN